jgi:hypothetical protein
MESDADPVEKAKYGDGTPILTMQWLALVIGFTLAFVSTAIEGWRNVFSLPVWSTSDRMVRRLNLIAAPVNLAFAMVLSEY